MTKLSASRLIWIFTLFTVFAMGLGFGWLTGASTFEFATTDDLRSDLKFLYQNGVRPRIAIAGLASSGWNTVIDDATAELDSIRTFRVSLARAETHEFKVLTRSSGILECTLIKARPSAESLRALLNANCLQGLHLINVGLTDEDLMMVGPMPMLETIVLIDNPITDESLSVFERFRNTRVRLINLSGTNITPDGIRQLQAFLPNIKIISSIDRPAPQV